MLNSSCCVQCKYHPLTVNPGVSGGRKLERYELLHVLYHHLIVGLCLMLMPYTAYGMSNLVGKLGVVDYIVFFAMLLLSVSTGLYHGVVKGGQKTTSQ